MKTRIIKRKGTLLSSVAMLSTAMLLTACGGDGGDSPVDDGGANPGESGAQALLYAYPDNGQNEISTAAPVVLRFSSAVNLGEAQNSITVYEGDAQSGTMVAVTPETVAGEPNNVLLQPDEDLKPNQTYTVVIEDLRLRKGTAKDQTLTFTTRPLHEGPKSLVVKDDAFEVSRRMPDGSDMEPVMDFSSFRFQFTQPIDRATASYGDGNTVVLRDSAGDPVDATLLIDGAYMTVDPDAEYLNAGETYTLDITAGLASTYGETLGAQSYTLTPKDSSPKGEPAILVQKLTQGTTSRLTGKPVNEVPVNGTLLGENKNITQASAEVVRAELADVTTYTDVTPIRLPKGTVLNGAEINPILIGGEVNAGFGSGDVTMTVLSDASGYLVPNPYAGNNPDALRIVHLMMDVGIVTSEARASGAFTQDLLHIELVGLAEVDPTVGVLNLDAVSVVEPDVLGQEYGYGMLSFQLQSYKDQSADLVAEAAVAAEDDTPPSLQSWVPGTNTDVAKPGDPIILNFDEPLSGNSVNGNVRLFENGNPVDIDYYVDGAALVIKPQAVRTASQAGTTITAVAALQNSPVDSPKVYTLEVDSAITDVAGNELDAPINESFELATVIDTDDLAASMPAGSLPFKPLSRREAHAPIILASYPGFPCALQQEFLKDQGLPQTDSSRDLANNKAGRCAGGHPGLSGPDVTPSGQKDPDDTIPITNLPANRPIIVSFSEEMDAASIVLGQTFRVERIDEQENVEEEIHGELTLGEMSLTFIPHEPWQAGELYRYTLLSAGYTIPPASFDGRAREFLPDPGYTCGVDTICDRGDTPLPLQTQALGLTTIQPLENIPTGLDRNHSIHVSGTGITAGGPDFVQFFRGGEETNSVLQFLTTQPKSDTNRNFMSERSSIGTSISIGGQPQAPYPGEFDLATEEYGPTNEPAQTQDPTYDPNGVAPAKNSAKLLSRYRNPEIEAQLDPAPSQTMLGLNVGCGYDLTLPTYAPGDPMVCPEHKFTYLTASLIAEVTDEVSEQGLKVNIWPSMVIGTSIDIVAVTNLQALAPFVGQTGKQMLRMRYEGADRTEPVTGYIRDGADGPLLSVELDLYVDAPYASEWGIGAFANPVNMRSYEISMVLEGDVEFLEDGRMAVEQFNTNTVDILMKLHGLETGRWGGYADLFIPAYGSRLNFLTQPIK